jgi:energy-coupling factor transporter ATP-binding protein EcfA2
MMPSFVWAMMEEFDQEKQKKTVISVVSPNFSGTSKHKRKFLILDLLRQKVLSSSFKAQLADHHFLSRYGRGDIIIFLGTSTAGKSTLIRVLKKLDPRRLDFSLDYRYWKAVANGIKNTAFSQYKHLISVVEHEDVAKIVMCNDRIKFKVNTNEQQRCEIEKSAKLLREKRQEFRKNFFSVADETFDEVILNSIKGIPTVIDITQPELLTQFFCKNFCAPIRIILTFCSLQQLSTRIVNRNEKALTDGEFSNRRNFFPLLQYSDLYKKKELQDEFVLEILTREQAGQIFEKHALESQRPLKEKFLQKLGFSTYNLQAVEIVPHFNKYDMIIDTDSLSPKIDYKSILRRLF